MSHSFDWEGECRGSTIEDWGRVQDATVTFLFNGDFSGNVGVNLPNWIADITLHHGAGPNGQAIAEVHIPFEAMKQLVFEHYRRKMIDVLESATGEALEAAVGPAMYKDMLTAFQAKPDNIVKAMEAKLAEKSEWKQPELPIVDNAPEAQR